MTPKTPAVSLVSDQPRRVVLIRCDGAPDIGLGHIVRCLALADELRDQHCAVRFLIRRGPVAVQMAGQAGYEVLTPSGNGESDCDWISRVLAEQSADAMVMDFRAGLSPEAVWAWRRKGVLTVSIDDPEDKRIACDLFFSPPVPQVSRLNWEGFTGELHVGWEWVLLRRQFANFPLAEKNNSRPVVLVTMGGSDPAGLTLKAVKALESLDEDFNTVVIVGGAFCHEEALETLVGQARRRFEIRRNVSNMAEVMAGADLAVTSFAVTAYELAAMGVPGIYLCLTEDHAESASAFDAARIGINLGVAAQVTDQTLAARVKTLLRDSELRKEMSRRCRELSDGRGAQRIGSVITSKLQSRSKQQAPV